MMSSSSPLLSPTPSFLSAAAHDFAPKKSGGQRKDMSKCRNFFLGNFRFLGCKCNIHVNMSFYSESQTKWTKTTSLLLLSSNKHSFFIILSRKKKGGGIFFSTNSIPPCEPPSARVGIRPFRGIPFTILERWIFLFECCASNIIFMKIMFSPLDTIPPSAEWPDIMASRSRLLKNIHVADSPLVGGRLWRWSPPPPPPPPLLTPNSPWHGKREGELSGNATRNVDAAGMPASRTEEEEEETDPTNEFQEKEPGFAPFEVPSFRFGHRGKYIYSEIFHSFGFPLVFCPSTTP